MRTRCILTAVISLAACVGTAHAQAGRDDRAARFGVQAQFADTADFGVGARALVNLSRVHKGLEGIASFDYFFPPDDAGLNGLTVGTDAQYWEVNANVAYAWHGRVRPYLGAGLNIAHASIDAESSELVSLEDSSTEAGLNLLAGARFTDRVFGEVRLELGGGDQFIVSAGVLF